MKTTIRRYFKAVGSLLDLAPATNYSKIMSSMTDAGSLRRDFEVLGSDFKKSIAGCNANKPAVSRK